MKNLIKQALFVIPILALIAAPIYLDRNNILKPGNSSPKVELFKNFTDSKVTSISKNKSNSPGVAFDTPKVAEKEKYAMMEPFANQHYSTNHPFDMYSIFHPMAWMQMMSNYMLMMYQMPAMYMQMTHPTAWTNPHMPNYSKQNTQTVMSPEDYAKWYEQVKNSEKTDKK